jgi:hypothetical protein
MDQNWQSRLSLVSFQRKDGDTTITLRRFRIMDVYGKRKGSWIQVASHTVIDPQWRAEQMTQPDGAFATATATRARRA